MGKLNLPVPQMDAETLTDGQAIRKIQSYLFQLNEQLRYELTHIDEENMTQGGAVMGLTREDLEKAINEQLKYQSIDLTENETIVALRNIVNQMQAALDLAGDRDGAMSSRITQLTNAFAGHVHSMSIGADGTISMGPPTKNAINPNISDTAFFRNAVSDARPSGIERIYLESADIGHAVTKQVTVFCRDDEEVVLPVIIDSSGV